MCEEKKSRPNVTSYLFPCYTIHDLDSIPSFRTWLYRLLWAQLVHELIGQALGRCGSSPAVSQGPANVQPWAGSWNNSSPHTGSEDGITALPTRWRKEAEMGRKNPVILGPCGWGKRCLQERGLRKCSSGKAEEIWSRFSWLSKFAQTDIIFLLNRRILQHSFNGLGVKKKRYKQICLKCFLEGRRISIKFSSNINCTVKCIS